MNLNFNSGFFYAKKNKHQQVLINNYLVEVAAVFSLGVDVITL